MAGPAPTVSARLLDRNGQPLPLPVTTAVREETHVCIASAELALAPLGPGDYLVELAVQRGSRSDTVLVAFRIVPWSRFPLSESRARTVREGGPQGPGLAARRC